MYQKRSSHICKNVYQQKHVVGMGPLLVPALTGIFMVHLERTPIPELEEFMKPWKRYVDDTITYIKSDFIRDAINSLNNFYEKNQNYI